MRRLIIILMLTICSFALSSCETLEAPSVVYIGGHPYYSSSYYYYNYGYPRYYYYYGYPKHYYNYRSTPKSNTRTRTPNTRRRWYNSFKFYLFPLKDKNLSGIFIFFNILYFYNWVFYIIFVVGNMIKIFLMI